MGTLGRDLVNCNRSTGFCFLDVINISTGYCHADSYLCRTVVLPWWELEQLGKSFITCQFPVERTSKTWNKEQREYIISLKEKK